jgi:hypothetical protein
MGWAMPARVLFAQRELEAAGAAVIAVIVLFFLLFMGAVYAYFALALSTIARKTHTPNTWLAWIPIANLILMINIAQKPVWWILLLFVPFVNLAIMVIVWMGIAKARGRPDWWGLFILAPIANFILPGVLAWTD